MRRIRLCSECRQYPKILITGKKDTGYQYKCFCMNDPMHSPGGEWSDSPQQALKIWNEKQRLNVRERRASGERPKVKL